MNKKSVVRNLSFLFLIVFLLFIGSTFSEDTTTELVCDGGVWQLVEGDQYVCSSNLFVSSCDSLSIDNVICYYTFSQEPIIETEQQLTLNEIMYETSSYVLTNTTCESQWYLVIGDLTDNKADLYICNMVQDTQRFCDYLSADNLTCYYNEPQPYRPPRIDVVSNKIVFNSSTDYAEIAITPTVITGATYGYKNESGSIVKPYFTYIVDKRQTATALSGKNIDVDFSVKTRNETKFKGNKNIDLGFFYEYKPYFYCTINNQKTISGEVSITQIDNKTINYRLNVSFTDDVNGVVVPITINVGDVITCYDPIIPSQDQSALQWQGVAYWAKSTDYNGTNASLWKITGYGTTQINTTMIGGRDQSDGVTYWLVSDYSRIKDIGVVCQNVRNGEVWVYFVNTTDATILNSTYLGDMNLYAYEACNVKNIPNTNMFDLFWDDADLGNDNLIHHMRYNGTGSATNEWKFEDTNTISLEDTDLADGQARVMQIKQNPQDPNEYAISTHNSGGNDAYIFLIYNVTSEKLVFQFTTNSTFNLNSQPSRYGRQSIGAFTWDGSQAIYIFSNTSTWNISQNYYIVWNRTGNVSTNPATYLTGADGQIGYAHACSVPSKNDRVFFIYTTNASDVMSFVMFGNGSTTALGPDVGIEFAEYMKDNVDCYTDFNYGRVYGFFVDSDSLAVDYFYYNVSAGSFANSTNTITDLDEASVSANFAGDDIKTLQFTPFSVGSGGMFTLDDIDEDITSGAFFNGTGINTEEATELSEEAYGYPSQTFLFEGLPPTLANISIFDVRWNATTINLSERIKGSINITTNETIDKVVVEVTNTTGHKKNWTTSRESTGSANVQYNQTTPLDVDTQNNNVSANQYGEWITMWATKNLTQVVINSSNSCNQVCVWDEVPNSDPLVCRNHTTNFSDTYIFNFQMNASKKYVIAPRRMTGNCQIWYKSVDGLQNPEEVNQHIMNFTKATFSTYDYTPTWTNLTLFTSIYQLTFTDFGGVTNLNTWSFNYTDATAAGTYNITGVFANSTTAGVSNFSRPYVTFDVEALPPKIDKNFTGLTSIWLNWTSPRYSLVAVYINNSFSYINESQGYSYNFTGLTQSTGYAINLTGISPSFRINWNATTQASDLTWADSSGSNQTYRVLINDSHITESGIYNLSVCFRSGTDTRLDIHRPTICQRDDSQSYANCIDTTWTNLTVAGEHDNISIAINTKSCTDVIYFPMNKTKDYFVTFKTGSSGGDGNTYLDAGGGIMSWRSTGGEDWSRVVDWWTVQNGTNQYLFNVEFINVTLQSSAESVVYNLNTTSLVVNEITNVSLFLNGSNSNMSANISDIVNITLKSTTANVDMCLYGNLTRPNYMEKIICSNTLAYDQIPIITLHDVNTSTTNEYTVLNGTFSEMISWLYNNSFQIIRMTDAIDYIVRDIPFPEKTIVLSFDDNYKSIYVHAYPILEKYGYVATAYVIYDSINDTDYMTQSDLDGLYAAGWEIGSHGMNSTPVVCENAASYQQQFNESYIELRKLGYNVSTFAWIGPIEYCDTDAYQFMEQVGYKGARQGIQRFRGTLVNNPYAVHSSTMQEGEITENNILNFTEQVNVTNVRHFAQDYRNISNNKTDIATGIYTLKNFSSNAFSMKSNQSVYVYNYAPMSGNYSVSFYVQTGSHSDQDLVYDGYNFTINNITYTSTTYTLSGPYTNEEFNSPNIAWGYLTISNVYIPKGINQMTIGIPVQGDKTRYINSVNMSYLNNTLNYYTYSSQLPVGEYKINGTVKNESQILYLNILNLCLYSGLGDWVLNNLNCVFTSDDTDIGLNTLYLKGTSSLTLINSIVTLGSRNISTNSFVNLSGTSKFNYTMNASWCYQETANITTDCGGLNTGNYASEGAWTTDYSQLYDENWLTGTYRTLGGNGTLYINYTQPTNSLEAKWKSSYGAQIGFGGPTTTTFDVPPTCFNQTPLMFKIISKDPYSEGYCKNDTDWYMFYQSEAGIVHYEEAVYWYINRTR